MKTTNTCTKCGAHGLVRIAPIAGDESHIAVGERLLHAVPVTKYVCIACGFVEEWIDDQADLARLADEYRAKGE